MVTPVSSSPEPVGKSSWARRLLIKAATLVSTGLLFGFGYDWAAPRFYGPEHPPGFFLGVLHGALMPIALPSLLMGRDVPIFAPNNPGRIYKIGYIGGINFCGLVFFGLAFSRPRKPQPGPAAVQ